MAYQSEIEKLEQRYRENPDQWFAALADSYRKAGSLDLALDVVRAGLEKRPNYVSGHIVLGRCLLQKPDDGAAAQAFEKVLSLDAENVIALKALSEVSERAGRMADARRWSSRLLEVDPMNEEAEQALARLKQAAAAAPPPPAPAAEAADAVGAAEAGGAAAEVASVAGFEATIAEAPPAPQPEPAGEFAIEKSHEATAPEPGEASLEPLELEGSAAPAASAAPPAGGVEERGLEPMEFVAPPAAEPAAAAPAAELAAQPFDSELAWGTGERISRQISQEDIEVAALAHEPSLEPAARELPGLETAEVPPVGVEERTSSTDLPLIYPDEVTSGADMGAREGGAPAGAEPEPVVTETMAELYAKQGLMAEARDIYRKLAVQRPGDAAVAGRLAELEGVVSGRRLSGGARLAADATGGPSARDFLAGVFGAGPAPASAAPAPAEPSALEAAFGGTAAGMPAPTHRASDEVSLASVFGEEPPPVRAPGAPAQPEAKPGGQGFSFDEFFGGQKKSPAAPGAGNDEDRGGEDEDDFKRWLKGLKS